MEREHRGRILAAVVGISLLGCGGSNGEPVTENNIGRKFAEIFCAGIKRCCDAQGMTFTTAHRDACLIDEAFLPRQRTAGVPDPLAFNPDGANECLKAAARYDCTNKGMVYASCDLVFVGAAALGSSCTSTRHCAQAPNAHAVCSASGSAGGTCVPATLFQPVGAACIRDDLECDLAEGLWCNAGTCARPSPIGGSCGVGPGWECAKGTYCGGLVPQMCTATTPVGTTCVTGSACTPPADCTNGVCTAARDGYCIAF